MKYLYYCNQTCIHMFTWCDIKFYLKAKRCPCKDCLLKINCSRECYKRSIFADIFFNKKKEDKHNS
jgi:hypothetical protein